jgi:hypothetical protein
MSFFVTAGHLRSRIAHRRMHFEMYMRRPPHSVSSSTAYLIHSEEDVWGSASVDSGRTDVVLHLERKPVGQGLSWRNAPGLAGAGRRACWRRQRCFRRWAERELGAVSAVRVLLWVVCWQQRWISCVRQRFDSVAATGEQAEQNHRLRTSPKEAAALPRKSEPRAVSLL